MFYSADMVVLALVPAVCSPLMLPVAASPVAAGWPSPADDYLEGNIDLSEHLIPRPAATFLVRASGWSMRDAGIHDGDELIVERGRTPRDGQIVIAILDGEFLVKQLRTVGRPRLVAAHPDFPDIALTGREVHIWGIVTCVLHHTP
ncbi:Probable repressor LexA [Mycobacteroides abscessus subsp. abscessus]|nr:Probable repressor LexA [Mycobacteroides abscessus subsp. abscessus]